MELNKQHTSHCFLKQGLGIEWPFCLPSNNLLLGFGVCFFFFNADAQMTLN